MEHGREDLSRKRLLLLEPGANLTQDRHVAFGPFDTALPLFGEFNIFYIRHSAREYHDSGEHASGYHRAHL